MKRNQLADEVVLIQRRPAFKTAEEFYEWAVMDEEEVIQSYVNAFNLFEIFENRLFEVLDKAYLAAGWSYAYLQKFKEIASRKTDWGNNSVVADKLHRIGQTALHINLSKAK